MTMEEKYVSGNVFASLHGPVSGMRSLPWDDYWSRPNGQALEPKGSDLLNYFFMEKINPSAVQKRLQWISPKY